MAALEDSDMTLRVWLPHALELETFEEAVVYMKALDPCQCVPCGCKNDWFDIVRHQLMKHFYPHVVQQDRSGNEKIGGPTPALPQPVAKSIATAGSNSEESGRGGPSNV
jgi:hypothetical protein